jgi:hypothetical protein
MSMDYYLISLILFNKQTSKQNLVWPKQQITVVLSFPYCLSVKSVCIIIILNWAPLNYMKKCNGPVVTSIFIVNISVITITSKQLHWICCARYMFSNSKASFSIFAEIFAIFIVIQADRTWHRILQLLTMTTPQCFIYKRIAISKLSNYTHPLTRATLGSLSMNPAIVSMWYIANTGFCIRQAY